LNFDKNIFIYLFSFVADGSEFCRICRKTSAADCTACPASVYYLYDGDCVEECPSGYEDNGSRVCIARTIPLVGIYEPGTEEESDEITPNMVGRTQDLTIVGFYEYPADIDSVEWVLDSSTPTPLTIDVL
jgi:hypothetical protein